MDKDYFIDKKRATILIIVVALISSVGLYFYTHPSGESDIGIEVRTYLIYSENSYINFYSRFFDAQPSNIGFLMVADIVLNGRSSKDVNFLVSYTENSLDGIVFVYKSTEVLIYGENGLGGSSYSKTYPFDNRGYRVYLFFRNINIENIELDIMVI